MKPPHTDRTFITMLVWPGPEGLAALKAFRERAQPLFAKYDVRVERALAATGKGQLVHTNPWDVPGVIQVFSVPSIEAFRAYLADPGYQALAKERDGVLVRIVAVIGKPISDQSSASSTSALEARLYGVAFAKFKPGGGDGLLEFNRRAAPLFRRHGMHVEHLLETSTVVTPVGSPLTDFAPERVIVFFLDDAASLGAYASDPEYKALAPIRDVGLERYDFFTAKAS